VKSIPAQEPGSQSHPGSGRRFKALVHHPQFLLGCRVQDHQASDRVSPQHADDAEPAVLQGVQRDGFVRPRDRRMSPGIAIKGARLASPGIEDGHVEHQIQFIRAVQDELACRPQTDAPCRLLDRGLAEMLQGAAEMLVGDGAKMAVAVDRFLTCAHAVLGLLLTAASRSRRSSPRHPGLGGKTDSARRQPSASLTARDAETDAAGSPVRSPDRRRCRSPPGGRE
jgi:hypothetical protein